MTFGERLKIIAKKYFKTQKVMADLIEMDEDQFSDYVRDRYLPSATTLERIARLDINGLRVSLNWLLTGDGPVLVSKEEDDDANHVVEKVAKKSAALSELRTVLQRAEELVDELE